MRSNLTSSPAPRLLKHEHDLLAGYFTSSSSGLREMELIVDIPMYLRTPEKIDDRALWCSLIEIHTLRPPMLNLAEGGREGMAPSNQCRASVGIRSHFVIFQRAAGYHPHRPGDPTHHGASKTCGWGCPSVPVHRRRQHY